MDSQRSRDASLGSKDCERVVIELFSNSRGSRLDSTMTDECQAAHQTFTRNLFGLPKELRELIYAEVFKDSTPIPLEWRISPAGESLLALGGRPLDPDFEEDVFKAYYTHSTFSIKFPEHQNSLCDITYGDLRCSCAVDWLPSPQACQYIRTLIIHCRESGMDPRTLDTRRPHAPKTLSAFEDMHSQRHSRRCFDQLVSLPRLSHLTITLQKRNNEHFAWAIFTPVLYALREKNPTFQSKLLVSFDALLEAYWSDPIWENTTEPGNVVEHPYEPMGFVDVTELVAEPTDEDRVYIAQHCKGQVMTPGRHILWGLLDETAGQRRALAVHYVIKEPALLRVRIREHFEVYKKMKSMSIEDGDKP